MYFGKLHCLLKGISATLGTYFYTNTLISEINIKSPTYEVKLSEILESADNWVEPKIGLGIKSDFYHINLKQSNYFIY